MSSLSSFALQEAIAAIRPPSTQWYASARAHLDTLTKPLGSLGRLEDLAAQLVSILGDDFATPLRKVVYVFAADHGVTAEGVSAYPSEVTRQMVLNFLSEGAAINVLTRLHNVAMHVVDVGVDTEFADVPGLVHCKIRRGTRNMLHEPAMSTTEMEQALEAGLQRASEAHALGFTLLAVGEMGIGNTTAASAITATLCDETVSAVTGKGTGVDAKALEHKQEVIEATMTRHFGSERSENIDPFDILRCVGGLEIAAIAGFIIGAARLGVAVVIDGFISSAGAAIACAIATNIRGYLFAGHQSEEPGHSVLLQHLELEPIFSLKMRLGEGTGAVLAMPILDSAMAIYNQMATFASAGVSEATE